MKKVIVLMAIAAIAAPAFAVQLTNNVTPSTSTLVNTNLGTTSTSTGTWVTSPIATGYTSSSAPFTGAVVSNSGSTVWWRSELYGDSYAGTYNIDTQYGTGAWNTYTSPDATQTVYTQDAMASFLVKNGTFNIQNSLWCDKMQIGSKTRTSTTVIEGVTYTAKSVLNIGSGGAIHVTGTEAVNASQGKMVFCYGSYMDSYATISGTGILSGVTRDGQGNAIGGRTLELGRSSQNANMVDFSIVGSQATVEAWSMRMNNTTSTNTAYQTTNIVRFIGDNGGVSGIKLFGAGANVLTLNTVATAGAGVLDKLDFQLGAAPTTGQVYTLFDLVDATAAKNAGKFVRMNGTVINEGGPMYASFGGEWYTFVLSYVGGTGNDVTLTYVPEPATLALLGLGGLVMARRRRA